MIRWEVGGEFDRRDLPAGPFVPLPTPNRLFGIATHALIAAWDALPSANRALFVPEYFCPEVVEAWQKHGIMIREYRDRPDLPAPDWDGLRPRSGDAVLAVNFFGARGRDGWARWQRQRPGVLLVEDHSHDPVSPWARRSSADFAFASLRKTMPISDGAILWSPRGSELPMPPDIGPPSGSEMKLAAMELKRDYLAGLPVSKEAFRSRQLSGERALLDGRPSAIAAWSAEMVEHGIPSRWRSRRRRNVRALMRLTAGASAFSPLFPDWPAGASPFNLVLRFNEPATRDACRDELIGQGIYTPVHWSQPQGATTKVRDLASRILTIPADQRYGLSDMRRIAAALMAFDQRR